MLTDRERTPLLVASTKLEKGLRAMKGSFQYEWWTVQMTVEGHGVMTAEYKGKSREHVVKQIEKDIAFTNSEKNLSAVWWKKQNRILDVFWNTLTLDRVGFQSGCRRID